MINKKEKNKILIVILLVFCVFTSGFYKIVESCVVRYNGYTIVLDAGHGGLDVK